MTAHKLDLGKLEGEILKADRLRVACADNGDLQGYVRHTIELRRYKSQLYHTKRLINFEKIRRYNDEGAI